MDDNTRNSAVVPIRALLKDIEIMGDLEKKRNYFLIISIDDEKLVESEKKKSGKSALRWEWKDHQIPYHPSSRIKIVIYRKTRTRTTKHVGQHTGSVVELLDNDPDTTIDLKDENGTAITSKPMIKITLSSVPQPENVFEVFMKAVDDDILRIKSGILASASNSSILGGLGTVLQSTYNIINALGIANAHPVLKASWTVMSAVYMAVKQTDILDDMVRDLADTLRETLAIAEQKENLLLIKGTDNIIDGIGRTSLKVASLIHEYTKLPFASRAAKQMSGDIKSRIEKCQKICKDLQEKFDRRVIMDMSRQVEIIKDEQLAEKIHKWLAAPDSSGNYNDARKRHQTGTCSWFIDGDRFREFQEKADFLWIKGKAGSGKTILCSSIVAKIKELRESENPSTIYYAYFFFDGRDSQKDLQQHDKLIRSLIDQFSHQCGGIPAALAELHKSEYGQPTTKSLEKVLHNIIAEIPSAYVIIDSLDECAERNEMLEWIKEIVSQKICTLHMVVVSRPERKIEDALQPLDMRCVDLAKESERDILTYLDQQISDKWDEEMRSIVKLRLAERSEGMFRWVALQLLELQECPDQDSVVAQLNSLPSGLYETYDRILLRVSKPGRNDTKTFLRWLCFTVHPISLSEIAQAIMVDLDAEDGPKYIPSRRYFNERDVLEKCSSLIIESEGKIKLAHFSVKEYLLSDHLHTSTSSSFHLATAELSHSLISQTCLAYLLQFDAENSLPSNEAISKSFPLAPYAAEHWIFHAKAGGIDKSESSWTLSLATRLFAHTGAVFTNWVWIWDLDKRGSYEEIPIGPPLYYASLAGLEQLSLHLSKEAEINAPGGRYCNALQAASSEGHEGIVKVLLEKGADPNAQGGFYGNALQAASSEGHEGIVKVLLEKGADPNAQGGSYGNALQAASKGGHEGIVRVLIEKGADPNAQGGPYSNALLAVSLRGHEGIVKVLIEKGADPNAQGGPYSNALLAASLGGHEGIVKVLIEKGADANAQGGEYGNALQAASQWGHEGIVKVLIEKGADPNAQGGLYGNALQAASHEGHEGIVKVLIEKGADPNAQGGHYGNVLQAASYRGHEGIVKVLIEKGTDPNAQGGLYGNALQAASEGGHEGVVKVLLEKGTDPNAQGGSYGNALQAASEGGHKGIVKVLLEKGADLNAQGGHYGNALQAASDGGHEGIVKVLLEKGADPNAQGGHYGNALYAASSGGHKGIVKVLLEKGADPKVQGGYYGNALQAASSRGHEWIVKVLLEKGADPKVQGGYYGNALQAASSRGHEWIVKVLLEKGADPNAQGGHYGNALYAASSEGHEGVVKVLMEKGADPKAEGGDYGNALLAASLRGHEGVVKVLLEKGTDPNAQGGSYGNALQAASSRGHEGIVKVLLEKGTDPNAQGGHYGNALYAASSGGHKGIVKVLLEKGADPKVQGGYYGNALQAASSRGHEWIVKVLLEKGADPNAQGGHYGDALYAASSEGHEGVVKVLMEKGADPNAQGGLYGNALYAASSEGHEGIVKVLLEKGADPNAQGGEYGNALQAASFWGHEGIVKVLLEKGADPNAQGGYYGNALQAASSWGHEGIVQLLLENGARESSRPSSLNSDS